MFAKFIKDCITGIDGESYDVGRVLWIAAFIVGLGLEVYAVFAKTTFDLQQYGIGVGALLAAGGVALKLKASTEPGEAKP
ncbi:MAG: amino acid ABC transporter substrate-binding protein [Patescibacteria group bacterium]|nr:amino acid ABC transporter substrate-binding protein [Patescibacteria group bacterium]